MGAIRLGERDLGVDLVLEILGDSDELTGVHRLRRFEQGRFGLADLGGPEGLGRAGHGHRVLVADLAASERLLGPGQLLQLVGHFDALGSGTARQLAVDPEPGDHADEAVGLVSTGLLEPARGVGRDRFRAVDDLAALDDDVTELARWLAGQPAGQLTEARHDPVKRRLARSAHAAIVNHGCDSCLSASRAGSLAKKEVMPIR